MGKPDHVAGSVCLLRLELVTCIVAIIRFVHSSHTVDQPTDPRTTAVHMLNAAAGRIFKPDSHTTVTRGYQVRIPSLRPERNLVG